MAGHIIVVVADEEGHSVAEALEPERPATRIPSQYVVDERESIEIAMRLRDLVIKSVVHAGHNNLGNSIWIVETK